MGDGYRQATEFSTNNTLPNNSSLAKDDVQVDLEPVFTATTSAGAGGGRDEVDELVLTVRSRRNDGHESLFGRQSSKTMSGHYSPPHQNMLPRNHVIGSRARCAPGGGWH